MKDAKFLVKAFQEKNEKKLSRIRHNSGKVKIKFNTLLTWFGWVRYSSQ